jgi:hypothetical protein
VECRKASRPTTAIAAREPRVAVDLSAGIDCEATTEHNSIQAAPIRIDVRPTASGRKWRASLDGKALGATTAPLVTAARYLIGKGVDPCRTVEMWHQHADAWALRGQIGAIAAVILDGEKKLQGHARNGSPVRQVAGGAP